MIRAVFLVLVNIRFQDYLMIFLFSVHIFFQVYADDIRELPEVLADRVHLLPEVLRKSRSDSTDKKYSSAFVRFHKWGLCNGLRSRDILPAKAFTVAIYLASLIQTANSPSPVIAAFYAIKWFHDMYGLVSPTNSKLVVNVLESAKRILSKYTFKKEPVTVEILSRLYTGLYLENNVKNQRMICACLVAFSGFLRSSELLSIKISDIVFNSSYMAIFIECSKTDKYRDGSWVMIAKTGTNLCPVENVKKLIKWGNLSGDDYLFCNICLTKDGYKVRKSNRKMSYSNLRDLFMEALSPYVSDVKKYCLHSLRSGGATAAANNGVKDRMFKRHGRWVSENAKDGYIKDNITERLSVSLSLGL